MSGEIRLPEGIEAAAPVVERGLVFWADPAFSDWEEALATLTEAFRLSRACAIAEESMVYVVANDALLGRSGPLNAMVAAGLLSAARTAAVEGSRKGWTANVIAYDRDADTGTVMRHAASLLESEAITGELIHIGPGHIGKALA